MRGSCTCTCTRCTCIYSAGHIRSTFYFSFLNVYISITFLWIYLLLLSKHLKMVHNYFSAIFFRTCSLVKASFNFYVNGRRIIRTSTAVYPGMYIQNVWKMAEFLYQKICHMYDIYMNSNILGKMLSYNMCELGRSSVKNCGINLRFS